MAIVNGPAEFMFWMLMIVVVSIWLAKKEEQ
jgi:hypothetical protein